MATTKKTATRKTAAKKTATRKAATKKAAAKKAPAKKTAVKKTTTRTTAAKKVPAKKVAAKKTATTKTAAKKAPARKVTAKKALANTRKLLRQKQAQARQVPAWQALDAHHGKQPQPGFQSEAARVQAEELHGAEIRLEGNQGSISTHDRHDQGKRDSR